MESMASSEITVIDEEQAQEQNIAVGFSNGQVVIPPEDGYRWKKYGQKYIVSIQKNRNYFICVNKNCKAKKRVDWPPNEPDNIDITYEGDHNHRSLAAGRSSDNEEDGITANQYDLATQVFGSARP